MVKDQEEVKRSMNGWEYFNPYRDTEETGYLAQINDHGLRDGERGMRLQSHSTSAVGPLYDYPPPSLRRNNKVGEYRLATLNHFVHTIGRDGVCTL